MVLLLLCTFGCAATNSSNADLNPAGCDTNLKTQADVTVPAKISVLPIKVEIREFNAGGTTEEVPEWSEQGKDIVKKCVLKHCKSNLYVEIVSLTDLSEENKTLLDQYRALYETVAANQRYIKRFPAWNHISKRVMTLGDGMAPLKKQLGTDAILFVSGYDLQSSTGRKAAFALYAVLTGGGSLPMGHSVLHTGVVELDSGDIIWSHTNISTSANLNNDEDVDAMVRSSFSKFPSVAEKNRQQ